MTQQRYYDRETLAEAKDVKIRIEVQVVYISEDGERTESNFRRFGQVYPSGNKVWVVWNMGDRRGAFDISWGLALEVLNDPYASPIRVNQDDPVKLHH